MLTLAACGSQSASTAGSPKTDPAAIFPLAVTRTGGIAGFHDVLIVADDGVVSVTQKGKAQRRCQLTPEATQRLTTAANNVPWARVPASSPSASFPDDLVTIVVSPAGGPIRLEDPLVGAAGPVFSELVNDLNGGRSASGMCTPL